MALLAHGLGFLKHGTAATLSAIDRGLNEEVIRLAVTGLSRAGKTVFITSMIQNLLALSDRHDSLPALSERLRGEHGSRLKSIRVAPADAGAIPWFDYTSKVALLEADKPEWPGQTDDLAAISLLLEVERKKTFGAATLGNRRIRIEILDYPGEWLLDLPLLSQTYHEWSSHALKLFSQEPRRSIATKFNDYVISNIVADAMTQDALMRRAHNLYKDALSACRTDHGLRYLQPGRFICPGPEGAEMPFLWFFPMEIPAGKPTPGTVADQLTRRFDAYKAHVTKAFFEPYFNRFNRQVLLVDILSALFGGRVAFEDTALAIRDISSALSTQRIARLSAVATKADHVPSDTRAGLAQLLRAVAERELKTRRSTMVTYRSAASIYSTTEGTNTIDGTQVPVVRGMVDGKMISCFVGQIPTAWPSEHYWDQSYFKLPQFAPRQYDSSAGRLEHLGLDVVLDDILGDLL